MRKLAAFLFVIVVLLIAVDRVAVAVAESKISDRVAASYSLPAKPSVTIRGFPFLTQVLAGDYQEIDVTAGRVPVAKITLTQLTARLKGVHASVSELLHGGGLSTVTADRAAGSAVIPFSELARWLPRGIRLSRAGPDVRVSGAVHVLGVRVPLSGTAAPSVTGAGIRVTPKDFTIPSGFTVPVSSVTGHFGILIPLTSLPLHLRVGSVAVTSTGLRAGASARNVQFASVP